MRGSVDFDKERLAHNLTPGAALEAWTATATSTARASLNRLLAWLEASPEITSDPNDFKAHPWFTRRIVSPHGHPSRIVLKAAYAAFAFAPELMRKVCSIPRVQTAGAATWLAQGFLRVYGLTRDIRYLAIAEEWMARLESLKIRDREESLWGFPFDWQSVILIPANTPLSYTSWQAAQTYFEYYHMTGSEEALRRTVATCQSMLRTFTRPVDIPAELCLSYSPYDCMQVYNVNALMGGLFSQLGAEVGNSELSTCGARLLNWVARGQQEDGRWIYFSKSFRTVANSVDHFHTAMTLQGLLSGYLAAQEHQEWEKALERGIEFYLNYLFDSKCRPRFSDSASYPTDVMSCAEGILFLDQLRRSIPGGLSSSQVEIQEVLYGLVDWVISDFQEKRGSFYFQGYPGYKIRLRSYRWGQGAMLKALASFLQEPA